MKVNGWRSLTAALTRQADLGVVALGATNKMFWSEHHREVMELAIDIIGHGRARSSPAPATTTRGRASRASGAATNYPVSPLQASFFFSRSETIWGGTAEIQRNIVGERVLGLPPRADARD